jgi:hypothetical protein
VTVHDSSGDTRKEWYVEGKRHRVDGPAVVCPTGPDEWWVDNNYCINAREFQFRTKLSDEDMIMLTLKYGTVGEK